LFPPWHFFQQNQRLQNVKEDSAIRSFSVSNIIEISNLSTICDFILAGYREIEVRAPDGNATLLHDVISALQRIESGAYGICGRCGQRISRKRLNALPWPPLCIKCQSELEQQVLGRSGFSDEA